MRYSADVVDERSALEVSGVMQIVAGAYLYHEAFIISLISKAAG
jgi:hypothetical protein